MTANQVMSARDIQRLEFIREEFRRGFELLSDLGPAGMRFGSARIKPDSSEYEDGVLLVRF